MATILLSAAGAAIGGAMGGSLLGLSGAVIGRAVGAVAGRAIDARLLGSGAEPVEQGRVDRFRFTQAGEGAPVARLCGRMRLGGQVIWASDFVEHENRSGGGGGKGAPRRPETRAYSYSVSLALALCEGEVARLGRIWADGVELDRSTLTLRLHRGSEDQLPDPLIEAEMGAGAVPAYRGIAYVVLKDLDLAPFGNRVPQFAFEVVRRPALATPHVPAAAEMVQAVALIPGTGEYALATSPVRHEGALGAGEAANVSAEGGGTDMVQSLEVLRDTLPNLSSVSLVYGWFGDDLRAGSCAVQPKVEDAAREGRDMPWRAGGIGRGAAQEVARDAEGRPVYGGTPADESVIEAIAAIHAGGQEVLLYPFLFMEILAGNGLPDPYGGAEQAALPWRGRITGDLAPGREGSPDGTAANGAAVAAFFGTAVAEDFGIDGRRIDYTGPAEWSYRRFILHGAALCAAAGGVAAFCIGSEMRGLTQMRDAAGFPAVDALRALAAEVRKLLPEAKLTYAADWSEYFGYHPADGSGEVHFHLDPLWADDEIAFVGIDNYMPLSDWRDGTDHADARFGAPHALDYLEAGIEGGEGGDWYYPTEEARAAQRRVPITDGAHGEDWVYRVKALREWWDNPHHPRLRQALASGGAESVVEVDGTQWIVHAFTEAGVLDVSEDCEVEALLVGGGGGSADFTGGGGAGGVLLESVTLAPGSYAVEIGAGGAGRPDFGKAGDGGVTRFAGLEAPGGGGAATYEDAGDGGSGGGGALRVWQGGPGAGLPGLGHAGGAGAPLAPGDTSPMGSSGGGGGAGGPGGDGAIRTGGDGGAGLYIGDRFGTAHGDNGWVASGGAGTPDSRSSAGIPGQVAPGGGGAGGTGAQGDFSNTAGMANTGGGAGGGSPLGTGRDGGSGLVLIRYRPGLIRQAEPTAWVPRAKPIWFTEIGCAAIDKGTNQPNRFLDAKSSESALPHFSSGRRDDLIQAQYLRAMLRHWSDPAHNPVSEVYGGPMLDMPRAHVWAWDARPWPAFPADAARWSDAENWARGHWLAGRLDAVPLDLVVVEICARAGLRDYDVSALHGLVRGVVWADTDSARAQLQGLMLAHGFQAVEREGKLRFLPLPKTPEAVIDAGRLALQEGEDGAGPERRRAPEAESTGRLRIGYVEAEGAYGARVAEAVHPGDGNDAVDAVDLPHALTGAEAQALAERWLAEARVARDTLRLALPPSARGIGAGALIGLVDGSAWRVDRVGDRGLRALEATRVEPSTPEPSDAVEEAIAPSAFVPPLPVEGLFLDLPLLTGAEAPHAPHVAVAAHPWPGAAAVYSAPGPDGFTLNTLVERGAVAGRLETPLFAQRPGIWDRAGPLRLRIATGALSAAEAASVLNGANRAAIGSGSDGDWEVIQFADATLVGEDLWEIGLRLRGQAGSDAVMPPVWPEGSLFVLLDSAVAQVDLPPAARGLARHWRIGPARRAVDDPSYTESVLAFAGVGLRPLSPVHLRARRGAAGMEVTWIRRTRIDGDGWEGLDVPLGEAAERYLLRVLDAGGLRREALLDAPHFTYDDALRAADGTAQSYSIEVAQVSDRVGPGPVARIEIDD